VTLKKNAFLAAVLAVMATAEVFSQTASDRVSGNLIQFNDNGAWCWYQDERAVIDTASKKLILGSDADGSGVGGSPRDGDVDAVVFDLLTGLSQRVTLREGDPSIFYSDDHNAPAFLVRPDGKYLGMYAAHFGDTTSHYRIYDGGSGGAEQVFNWKLRRPGGSNFQTTYSNLHYLSAEGRTYNFVRGNNKSPNSMVSTDLGTTWSYGGQLTRNAGVGYNNGYYRYSGNGVDRIEFLFTDYHPRDYNTSIYHGYIKNAQSFRTDGTLVDANILDTLNIPTPADFTLVFPAGTVVQGDTMYRCWNADVQRYSDGTIAAIITARANNNEGGSSTLISPDLRFLYCRYDGSSWSYTYLGKAGLKLYASEQDYTGLGALHPQDPSTIYLSTTYDPRNNASLGVHEIFKGVTADNGASWSWTAITSNSVKDNLRPIVPSWNSDNTALLWWRGSYSSAQTFNAAVVGILDHRLETVGKMTYVDASTANTTLSTGAPLTTTGPDANGGPADGQWHLRTNYGNGGSVLTSAELGGENAPALRTSVVIGAAGAYDVWANFWANPTADWRIKAGLSSAGVQFFRQMACKEVDSAAHDAPLVLAGGGNTFLYQAYVGRVRLLAGGTIDVYVDDDATQTGTTGTLIGNTARTWYDGVSYARVEEGGTVSVAGSAAPGHELALNQNYPNPFNPSTRIQYYLPEGGRTRVEVFDILGRLVATLVDGTQAAGLHAVSFDGSRLSSGIYVYRLSTPEQVISKRMVFVR